MSRVMKAGPLVILWILIIAAPSVRANWIQDGVPLCNATGDQYSPRITSDGAGGAIVTWYDARNGNNDIYVQRVNASGAVLWTANGVALCTAPGSQSIPAIVSDGAGGAIVTWEDNRSGSYDIYARRVDASGAVQWANDGVALCTATGNQWYPTIASDGAGGAIVTWADYRNGNWDIYARRVDASGAVQWATDGVALCTATGDQDLPQVTSDGVGNAIVTWEDRRSGSYDIYARRVNTLGIPSWTADGVAICTATGNQRYPQITSDGAFGAIVTWQDQRSGGYYDVYARRVIGNGTVLWTTDGVALCPATGGDQQVPQITSDGAGGAIVAWMNGPSANADIYAQRVNASGAVQWIPNRVLCWATGTQQNPQIASDGAGGAIVTWQDLRGGGYYDIYAQRVNASGAYQWTANGVAICAATGNVAYPMITAGSAGGAIVTWYDNRIGNWDIYAQRVDASGFWGYNEFIIADVRDVPGDQGGFVDVAWRACGLDLWPYEQITNYTVWRAISHTSAQQLIAGGASVVSDAGGIPLNMPGPVVRFEQLENVSYAWEYISTVNAYHLSAYEEVVPTQFDSTSSNKGMHFFQVIAHTSNPYVYWTSPPDSGYSVDNLSPAAPKGLAAEQQHAPAGLKITWDPNVEPDLDHYAVYRGASADFIPGPGNLIASPKGASHFDGEWTWDSGYSYKVSAFDVHGNESGPSLLAPDNVTAVETGKAPKATYLSQNFPNPFNPVTRIEFGLREPAAVSLRIYDAAGRMVRELAEGRLPSGRYAKVWDGKDTSGSSVASGVYFYRLDAGSFTQTKKMVLLK